MTSHRCSEELNELSRRKSIGETAEKGGLKAEKLQIIETVLQNALGMIVNYSASLICSPGVFGEPVSAVDQMTDTLQKGSMPMPFLKVLLTAAHENDEEAFNQVSKMGHDN